MDPERADQILALARAVPVGFVTTYGDLSPSAPRLAGSVLAACTDRSVPWHRVVRADGSLAKGSLQRRLLEAEGVPFTRPRRVGAAWRVAMEVAHIPREALLESR